MRCVRRGRCHLSAQRGWDWNWRVWTSDWRTSGRDLLSFWSRFFLCLLWSYSLCISWNEHYILLLIWPSQVNMLQKSLLRQNEDQGRVAALEQQVLQIERKWAAEYLNNNHSSLSVFKLKCHTSAYSTFFNVTLYCLQQLDHSKWRNVMYTQKWICRHCSKLHKTVIRTFLAFHRLKDQSAGYFQNKKNHH